MPRSGIRPGRHRRGDAEHGDHGGVERPDVRPAPGKTEWHRVVVWDKQAETLSEYLLRGRQIYVEGRLQTRQWDDRDGNKRYTTEVRADRVVLLGDVPRRRGAAGPGT